MKFYLSVFLVSCFYLIISCNQSKKTEQKKSTEEIKIPKIDFIKTIPITGVVSLAFAKTDTAFNTFYEPYILVGQKEYQLEGFSDLNRSNGQNIALSPNGDYFIMQFFEFGCTSEEEDYTADFVNTNDFCAIIDIRHKRLIHKILEYCDGEWNAQGQWVSNGKIVLSLD